jgi:hypothetical protein
MLSLRCAVMVLVAALMVLQTSSAQEATTTKPCRMLKCRPDCKPGKGSDGCPICDCPPRCENYPCDDGYVCELKTVQCFREPCFPVPKCVAAAQEVTTTKAKRCRMIKCRPDCKPGKGPDGCPICDCPPRCQGYPCGDGQVCELKTLQCFRAPCYPVPTCVAAVQDDAEP